jgi:hypothetical protein
VNDVNPSRKAVVDMRTPLELIELNEETGGVRASQIALQHAASNEFLLGLAGWRLILQVLDPRMQIRGPHVIFPADGLLQFMPKPAEKIIIWSRRRSRLSVGGRWPTTIGILWRWRWNDLRAAIRRFVLFVRCVRPKLCRILFLRACDFLFDVWLSRRISLDLALRNVNLVGRLQLLIV